jgi:hypothetical protein
VHEQWSPGQGGGDIAVSDLILRAAGTMESIVGLSVAMLGLATLVMAVGAALQAAVGLGLSLFVVPLLALIDVRPTDPRPYAARIGGAGADDASSRCAEARPRVGAVAQPGFSPGAFSRRGALSRFPGGSSRSVSSWR